MSSSSMTPPKRYNDSLRDPYEFEVSPPKRIASSNSGLLPQTLLQRPDPRPRPRPTLTRTRRRLQLLSNSSPIRPTRYQPTPRTIASSPPPRTATKIYYTSSELGADDANAAHQLESSTLTGIHRDSANHESSGRTDTVKEGPDVEAIDEDIEIDNIYPAEPLHTAHDEADDTSCLKATEDLEEVYEAFKEETDHKTDAEISSDRREDSAGGEDPEGKDCLGYIDFIVGHWVNSKDQIWLHVKWEGSDELTWELEESIRVDAPEDLEVYYNYLGGRSILLQKGRKSAINKKSATFVKGDNRSAVSWEIDRLVDKRVRAGGVEYKVRWKGFSSKYDEWKLVSELGHAKGLVREYKNRY